VSARGQRPTTFRWRARSYLLFGSGILLAGAGFLVRNPAPLLLAVPLLLAPVAAALLGPRSSPRARLDWRVEGVGPEVEVSGTLALDAPTDARDIVLEFRIPPGLTERRPQQLDRDAHEIHFALHWRAGEPVVVPVPPPRVVWRDPASLVERGVYRDPSPLVVERYPAELVRIGAARLERTIAVPGETVSRGIGPSGDFFGIRLATSSDPPRRINWKASARAGRLLANEFRLERTGDVLLLLDARPTELGLSVDAQLFSLSLAAAHGIAESFLREKARVGLGIYGEFLDVVPLAGGRTQGLRIRRALLDARLTTSPGPPERCAVSLRRYFPTGVTTILFSSLADEETSHLVPYVRRRGFPVVVLSPSPLPLINAHVRPDDVEAQLLARIARLLRRRRLAQAWRDAPVVDWEEYWSVEGLVDLLRRPGRVGRGW
jgi:uncharacterized protein (DUF58 family)